ncbi:MAG: hypothetical protein KC800_03970 [Candidatus Eremiobacteraeota bacterium]|nr:hypothetical protein [Candidatus Eremiobacteraeota bacterium]
MQPHILEEARKIDIGRPIEDEAIQPAQVESSTFLDYGVPALLIGAGIAWYISRNEQRLGERAKLKGQLAVERLRGHVEQNYDKEENISRSVSLGVSESLAAMEPAGNI